MAILLLNDDLFPGGAARHVADLANGLAAKGGRVYVAATDGGFRARLHPAIPFTPLSIKRPDSFTNRYAGTWDALRRVVSIVRSEHIHVIHTHKRLSDLIGRTASQWTDAAHVSTCHSLFTDRKPLSVFGEHTIAICEAIRENLIRRFGKKPDAVSTVYNGIAPFQRFSEVRKAAIRKRIGIVEQRIVVSVGMFYPAKDHETLLEAFARIGRDDAALLLVGNGPGYAKLEKQVHDLKLTDRVFFSRGAVSVEEALNIADFCCLASLQEGLPYALLEAASLGKPHIATDVGGVKEFVLHEHTGLLVPPRAIDVLTEALRRLLENPAEVERMGENARSLVHNQHDENRCIDQTIAVYERFGGIR